MEIIGNLTAAATVKKVNGDKQVINFTVAVNSDYTSNGERKKRVAYFNCSYWRKQTGVVPYLLKGTLVQVTGDTSVNAWTNKEGEPRASLNFHVDRLKLHGSRKRTSNGNGSQAEEVETTTDANDDLPF